MELHFNGSSKPTLGFEIELQLIDPVTLDLTPSAEAVLQKGLSHVKAEIHQSMLEVDTSVCQSVKECRQDLETTFTALFDAVDSLNFNISIGGTHPFQKWPERRISSIRRYLELKKKYRWLAKRMNVYGLHVHVGVDCADRAIAVTNGLVQFLPHFLALSANSPFWHGQDTGMLSCRPSFLESFPSGGPPPFLENWSAFTEYYQAMFVAQAIGSPKDLYWYVRPNLKYGTVEVRMCDAMATLDEMMAMCALIQNLVVAIGREPEAWQQDPKMQWFLRQSIFIAERDGLDGIIATDLKGSQARISDLVYDLIEKLMPTAIELDNRDELLSLKEILVHGNGATRQKKHFLQTKSLKDVVQYSIDQFRTSCVLHSVS